MDVDDDDMADLFSFSAETVSDVIPHSTALSSTRERTGTDDSLLEMIANESAAVGTGNTAVNLDQETQDILNWLDDNEGQSTQISDSLLEAATSKKNEEAELSAVTPPGDTKVSEASTQDAATEPPSLLLEAATVVDLPPTFATFQEALESSESTPQQIRELYRAQTQTIDPKLRPELYCRMLCSKSLEDTLATSLADSFQKWELPEVSQRPAWITELATRWAPVVSQESRRSSDECREDLTKLLMYYFKDTIAMPSPNEEDSAKNADSAIAESTDDSLVPATAAILLSTGMPAAAVSVALSKVLASHLPLLALKSNERWEAALLLHTDFYALATYHLPLLVFHLDRYLPGWYWPSLESLLGPSDETKAGTQSATVISRNLQQQGKLPGSWLLTMWAGAASPQSNENDSFPVESVLNIWDKTFLLESKDVHFFLALALLQDISDDLLLLTDDALANEFQSFLSSASHKGSGDKDIRCQVAEWWDQAESLQSRTPESVISTLNMSVDKALMQALDLRRERAEAALEARLKAEAEAHQKAQEENANAARERLNRARLVAFYRVHAPDKESNIDEIMKTYDGRLDILNSKLLLKYGEGFNPAIASSVGLNGQTPTAKASENPLRGTSKLLAAMNRGLGNRRKVAPDKEGQSSDSDSWNNQVTVTVSPGEVLPAVCWSKDASSTRGSARRRGLLSSRKSLKYYIIDARSDEAATEQGRFPTAVSLSPEALLDPERIKMNEEMFESLRGAVHIVIMGEGFSALPTLYSQKSTQNLIDLISGDDSRTNLCALFFIKKGFPFVSIMEGGFAAAHSWLIREGPAHHLSASSVLVDYNPESSLFGQMEKMHNETASEKAQRVFGNLLESSLVAMTKRAQQLENIAADMEKKESNFRMPQLFRPRERQPDGQWEDTNRITFLNPFAGRTKAPNRSDEATENPKSDGDTAIPTKKQQDSEFSAPVAPNEAKDVQRSNPFKGLSAALNNSVKTSINSVSKASTPSNPGTKTESKGTPSVPAVLKRNPFARFGGQQQGATAQVSGQQTFARMNQFRKSTMARIRTTNGRDDGEEESITFGSAVSERAAQEIQNV
ncbi:hypothetical protein FisN_1Lh327 [Fistulifera solaris]|uniref:Rhodanese domain-containing protein n=1 Tax=Fistulifera solaris TaxID=1519565 RepID=A0A1Z5K454_FISSO|nr:hypothetical protein FisN_1Lh327 [Fistulifera solaris]|eukprot:GAX21005.1 hypothetical protein FisN_1Lh327 [Fistulifera solaris]